MANGYWPSWLRWCRAGSVRVDLCFLCARVQLEPEGWNCLSGAFRLTSKDMVRLVLFDIDGTLIRTGGAGVKAFAKVFSSEFNASDGFERLKFAGRTDFSLVREFFGFHQIPPT